MEKRDFWRAEAQAAEVLAKRKIAALPVDPFGIAAGEGIVCETLKSSGVSGCLCGAGNTFTIFYNDSINSEGFRRFTVAHELGHYFLEGHYKYIFSDGNSRHVSDSGYSSDDPIEREADAFAAALLMPPEPFKTACARVGPGFKTIETLSEKCVSSLTATAIRYADLSDDPIAIIGSSDNRVQFAFLSAPLKQRRNLIWPKKNSGVPEGTATHSFNRDPKNVTRSRRTISRALMDVWFDCGGTAYVSEEVVGLGSSYGLTLTILVADPQPDPEYEEDSEEDNFENMLPSDRWRQPRRDE
ncbi:MAG TPA: ImmA/IrrE family metallo-endopeptidase [Candidatus Acidoferrales bacterium]|nr:ImmA/IrrE family metallo-endopeptidase [Candidatus Acidoferrales bacterium]